MRRAQCPRGAIEQARRAVPADIVKRAHHAVVAADREQHFADEIEALVVAGIRDLRHVADDLPGQGGKRAPARAREIRGRCRPTTEG